MVGTFYFMNRLADRTDRIAIRREFKEFAEQPRSGFPGTLAYVTSGLTLIAWCSLALAADRSTADQMAPGPTEDQNEERQSEQEHPVSYGAQVAFKSGHADRGFVINDRPVVQPVVWTSGTVAAVSLWGSFPLAQTTDGSRPQIMELELTREDQWGSLRVAPAVRMYFYRDPQSVYSTRSLEGWLYLSFDAGPFSFFSNQSVDVMTYRGAYYGEAGIESEWRVSPTLEVGASVGAGWADSKFNTIYVDVHKSAFNRASAEGWLTVHVVPQSYIRMHFEFSTIVDPWVRAEARRPTFVFTGLATGVEF